MKKIVFLLALSAILFSCNSDNAYTVNGTIKGLEDGKKVTLEKQQQSLGISMPIDTAVVKGGKFVFEGKAGEPSLYQISVEGINEKSYFILEKGDITVEINKDSLFLNKMGGTYNNEQLSEFNASTMQIQKKMRDFQTANNATMKEAMQKNDTATINRLKKVFLPMRDEVRKEMNANAEKYMSSHPKSFITAILLESFIGAPFMDGKKLEEYYNNLDPELKKTTVGKSIEKKLADLKNVNVGRRAPDFSAPDTTGKKVSLNESLNAITIIDFWASWCGPCRQENPNMVALYKEFHSQGLNIIGVSLDKDASAWKEAIAKDGLEWTQVSNLKYWDDPIAATYGVKSIPATFVLNQYGVVVAKDLKGQALRNQILKMLNKKPMEVNRK